MDRKLFEHIPLLSVGWDYISMTEQSVTLDNESLLRTFKRQLREQGVNDPDNLPYIMSAGESYNIRGSVRCLLELPMTTEAREHYIYLQSFCYLKADSSYYTKRTYYPAYMLCVTYEGAGELEYEGVVYQLCEGDAFVIDARKEHYYHARECGWTLCSLNFCGGISDYIYNNVLKCRSVVYHLSNMEGFQDKLENVLYVHCRPSVTHDFKVSLAIENLLGLVSENEKDMVLSNEYPEYIQLLLRYIESNYQKELDLDMLSSLVGVSKYYLCRQFKKYVSFSPKDYIIQVRISHACYLLQSTNIPSYKIGILVGIPSEANFINLFKKRMGVSPSEYRLRR